MGMTSTSGCGGPGSILQGSPSQSAVCFCVQAPEVMRGQAATPASDVFSWVRRGQPFCLDRLVHIARPKPMRLCTLGCLPLGPAVNAKPSCEYE